MKIMIDADKAIELLEGLYRDGTDFDTVRYNICVGAAVSEIKHLKKETELGGEDMTVAELIEKLQEMPQDAPVCCTGDELEAVYYGKRLDRMR